MNTPTDLDILLIEDNPRDAELTIRALQKRNLANHVEWVKDGAAALAFLFGAEADLKAASPVLQRRPRLILVDLKLPKVDGLDVLRQIKAHNDARTIPVVILSSSREEQDIARSYDLGVNSYIVKPVSFDSFSEAVAHLGMYWLLLNLRPETNAGTRKPEEVR